MIKLIIFDVYGTLINTGRGSVEAAAEIFSKYGLSERADDIYRHWKQIHKRNMRCISSFIPEREIFVQDLKELFGEYGINDNAETSVQPMLRSLLGRKPYPDAERAAESLLKKYDTAIGSVTDTYPLTENLKGTVFEKIPHIYTSESLQVYKPSPGFYEKILSLTGRRPGECLFVGDSIDEDIRGPKEAGMRTALINRKGITDKEILSMPDTVISSMEQLEYEISLL